MTTRTKIKEVLKGTQIDQTVNVKGWVRTFRNNSFIAINDGSSINNLQAVINFENTRLGKTTGSEEEILLEEESKIDDEESLGDTQEAKRKMVSKVVIFFIRLL